MAELVPVQGPEGESHNVICEDAVDVDQHPPTLQELMKTDQSVDDICFEYLKTMGIYRDTIVYLLTDECHTDEWQLQQFKKQVWQEFIFWHGVVAVIEESNELSFKDNLPVILTNLNFIGIVVNVSSFVRKIRNKIKIVMKKRDAALAQELAIGVLVKDVGPICEQENINIDWLQNPMPLDNPVNFTKGLLCELRRVRIHHSIPLKKVSLWIKFLYLLEYIPDPDYLKRQMESIYNKKQNLLRTGKTELHDAFMSEKYTPPLKSLNHASNIILSHEHKDGTNSTSLKVTEQQKNIKSLEMKYRKTREQKFSSNLQLFNLRKEYKKLKLTSEKNASKLSEFSTRNVNKRLKRKQNSIAQLQMDKNKIEKEIKSMRDRNLAIKQKFKGQSALLKYYKQKSKTKTCPIIVEPVVINESVLSKELSFFENENEKLKETIDELMNAHNVNFFKDGKYTDSVREVYAALLSMNVGVKNVEKIVRTVLEKMGGLSVDRLPQKTFAETMLVEAKLLAQMQAAEAMLNSANNTLHTDGTKRDGREFGGLQIGTETGQYSVGISEMVRGDSQHFLDMIDNILLDMSKLLNEDYINTKNDLLLSIKNTMTDRHIVNTCLKNSLEKMRLECLPNTDDTTNEIKKKMSTLNGFKCNLHVLVNFASQAESGLKIWEQSVLEVEENATSKFTYNQSTTDFIRACTKLCVPGADEKSGYGSLFLTFLKQLETPCDLKMTTFHGHRINLLFAMGAAVFYHHTHVKDFIDSFFAIGERNALISAVYNYVNNPVYLAGCRAFGIIDKLFTGPIWRIIENCQHILDLNNEWLTFKMHVEEFSRDALELIEGKVIYADFTNKDILFDSLFSVEDPELNSLTIEAIQIILLNFSIIIERQLCDILPGGKLNENTTGVDGAQLRKESMTVKPTNIISERDFANLDRLKREKPNANVIALEGLILFSNNKTLKWLNEMETTKKSEIMKIAREKTPSMIQQFKSRKEQIRQKHVLLLKQRKEEKVRKEKAKQVELEQLTKEIEKVGGLWVTKQDLEKNLKKLSENAKLDAVKTQLKFRKKVLKCKAEDKTMLQFSSNGIPFKVDELISHLEIIISGDLPDSENVSVESNLSTFVIKSKSERDEIMHKQRELVLKKISNIKSKNSSDNTGEPSVKKTKKSTDRIPLQEILPNTSSSIETIKVNQLKCKVGQNVAVAYMDTWYPGQIISDENSFLTVKFLHPGKKNVFMWPSKDDISVVDQIFVFYVDFDILPKDSGGRTWCIPKYLDIQKHYQSYYEKYFD